MGPEHVGACTPEDGRRQGSERPRWHCKDRLPLSEPLGRDRQCVCLPPSRTPAQLMTRAAHGLEMRYERGEYRRQSSCFCGSWIEGIANRRASYNAVHHSLCRPAFFETLPMRRSWSRQVTSAETRCRGRHSYRPSKTSNQAKPGPASKGQRADQAASQLSLHTLMHA